MDELISVIVPVYKAQAYLDECVTSVLGQTYRNLELILVDDGSPDNSGAMCEVWARRDERVRVLHQKNAGPGAARNTGMEAAKGTFLSFVDSDDTIHPSFLEKLHDGMEDAQLAVCGIDCEEEELQQLTAEKVSLARLSQTPSRYAGPVYVNSCVNKMYRVDIIRQHSLCIDVSMRRAEDVCFVAQYLKHCQYICVIPDRLYHYRSNEASITHTFYTGIARDEILGWQAQRPLFLPDDELSAEERNFFSVWEYGKIQSILRYILSCRASFFQKKNEIRQLLSDPQLGSVYTDREVCRRLGRKKVVYAWLAGHHWFDVLLFLFCMAGVG